MLYKNHSFRSQKSFWELCPQTSTHQGLCPWTPLGLSQLAKPQTQWRIEAIVPLRMVWAIFLPTTNYVSDHHKSFSNFWRTKTYRSSSGGFAPRPHQRLCPWTSNYFKCICRCGLSFKLQPKCCLFWRAPLLIGIRSATGSSHKQT